MIRVFRGLFRVCSVDKKIRVLRVLRGLFRVPSVDYISSIDKPWYSILNFLNLPVV